ncbi:hypothetical protein [Polaromonas sp. UC242_47]|uniref:hypothetical protein n=1 Tax=Polaromonas sp. UC242_47 TaxID=3374626 RepID=UPI0037923FBE
MAASFFANMKRALSGASRRLDDFAQADQAVLSRAKWVSKTFEIILANADEFDENCQVTIEWIGSQISSRIAEASDRPLDAKLVDELFQFAYRLVIEFDLSVKGDLSMELSGFKNFVADSFNDFPSQLQTVLTWAKQDMPIAVMKKLLGTTALSNLRNIEGFAKDIDAKFSDWSKRLSEEEDKASALADALTKYETAFNFVGLYSGFDDLSKVKAAEVRNLRQWTSLFGALAVVPLLIEMLVIYLNMDRLQDLKWQLIVSAIPVLSLTVLLLYFFRIALRSSEGAKSQLLQLELRKTLCQFIQSYASYSSIINKENPDSLKKFENVIFSGIVSSDEKIPATFDGIDQIAKLVKAIK